MDKEIINTDGSRNWEANILFDNVKRLEQDYVNLSKAFEHLKTSYQENQEYVLELRKENAELKAENARKKDMIDRQWKLLKQCGVSGGGELKRVSYLLEKLREENETLKRSLKEFQYSDEQHLLQVIELDNKNTRLKQTLQEIKEILCQGRTFYDGYFDNPESLGRIDKAIYLITKAEEE